MPIKIVLLGHSQDIRLSWITQFLDQRFYSTLESGGIRSYHVWNILGTNKKIEFCDIIEESNDDDKLLKNFLLYANIAILFYDSAKKNYSDLLNQASIIQKHNTQSDFQISHLILAGEKSNQQKKRLISSDEVTKIENKIAETINITPKNISRILFNDKKHEKKAFQNCLKKYASEIGENINVEEQKKESLDIVNEIHKKSSDECIEEEYIHFSIQPEGSTKEIYTTDQHNCICFYTYCCVFKWLFFWGMGGCLGALCGMITGVIDPSVVIEHVGNVQLHEFSVLLRGTLIGASSGLIAGPILFVFYLICKRCFCQHNNDHEPYYRLRGETPEISIEKKEDSKVMSITQS